MDYNGGNSAPLKDSFWQKYAEWGDSDDMINVEKRIDVNAHVQDISCQIKADGSGAVAQITFMNCTSKAITAARFDGHGYDVFGNPVIVNGNEKFFLVINDVNIPPETESKKLLVTLPNTEIKRLQLTENQICYADDTVTSYAGAEVVSFTAEKWDSDAAKELEIKDALEYKLNTAVNYKPVQLEKGWFCCCGKFYTNGNDTCHCCGTNKEAVFSSFIDEEVEASVLAYRRVEEGKEALRRAEAERKAAHARARKKKLKLFAFAGAILIVLVAILAIRSSLLSGRQTYSSASSMELAMQGPWTYYGTTGNALWQLTISGSTGTLNYGTGSLYEGGIRWHPSTGAFSFRGSTYIVNRGANSLRDGDFLYSKGGSLYSLPSSSYSSESGYIVLNISDVKVTNSGNYTICTGTVTNNGTKTYSFIEVKGAFEDSSGNVVDTDWTYAAGSEGLAPGESTTFRMSVPKNTKVYTCTVTILDYND